ncbi:Crp/Fnr family transcriptional regulator [Putridiphycobacter roseus]|uniref:Crp/Fnr family transcriptional regulator n=1 Tax=Putridiphycobacter roseus TaxID=2219161 RepID=A0A2W1NPW9_9FLAO|nr:Crp/Fnr family transcriptional regulator [Putridiphycobacter roseus]PZE17672.1 Crp/Fnr family transcriptional regulator [Putridiphycobacter roseus]
MDPLNELILAIEKAGLWESEKTFQRNEFVKVNGQIDLNIYFIVTGCLRIYIQDESNEHTIRFGYPKNLIAALDSYLSEAPSDLVVQAIRKTKVKIISKGKFQALIQSSPVLHLLWQNLLEALIFQQLEREKDILIQSPAKRYARVLARSPQLFQEVPNKYIASYLRMTPETLSRLKR